jgi:hypothetical protein
MCRTRNEKERSMNCTFFIKYRACADTIGLPWPPNNQISWSYRWLGVVVPLLCLQMLCARSEMYSLCRGSFVYGTRVLPGTTRVPNWNPHLAVTPLKSLCFPVFFGPKSNFHTSFSLNKSGCKGSLRRWLTFRRILDSLPTDPQLDFQRILD